MVRAYSSGVEHYVDIVGVPSSNLGTPTIGSFFIATFTRAPAFHRPPNLQASKPLLKRVARTVYSRHI